VIFFLVLSKSASPRLSLSKPVPASRWYDTFTRLGVTYGPAFQCMSSIRASSDSHRAQGLIRMQPTDDSNLHESRYIMHPTALDGVIQLAVVAAHQGRSSDCKTAHLPVSFKALKLVTCMDQQTSGHTIADVKLGKDGFTSNIFLEISTNQEVVLDISGLRCVKADGFMPMAVNSDPHPFTKISWQPEIDLLTESKLSRLFPSQDQVIHSIKGSYLPMLDQLAMYQIVQFHATHHEIFARGSKAPNLQRYLDWMSSKIDLMRRNLIPGGQKAIESLTSDRESTMRTLRTDLLKSQELETRLMYHMYESLPSIFKGELTGIQAASQNNYLNDIYEFMTLFHVGNVALKDLVLLISHKNPRLQIFEVGGGTGSATREVLHGLRGDKLYPGYDSYTFTDITPSFLGQAEKTFANYSGVEYAAFDMQNPPAEQGFQAKYDLVIASNALHATSDIQKTLISIRQLLKSGGKLAVFEIIEPSISWMMILGTFSDVWKGDHDSNFPRYEGPFLTRAMWNEVLPRCGFSGLDIDLDHFTVDRLATVIIATAAEFSASLVDMPIRVITLVYRGKPSSFVSKFQEHLGASGCLVDLVALSRPGNRHGRRVISLVEIDTPLFLNIAEEEWNGFKEVTFNSNSVLWVTRGNLLDGGDSEYAIISGLVCAIHTENKSSRFIVVDVESNSALLQEQFEDLVRLEERATQYAPGDDFEYRSKGGILYVSRLQDDEHLNDAARDQNQTVTDLSETPTSESKDVLSVINVCDSENSRKETQCAQLESILPAAPMFANSSPKMDLSSSQHSHESKLPVNGHITPVIMLSTLYSSSWLTAFRILVKRTKSHLIPMTLTSS
jgi:ubiquinone/menaquinone biosynthesis C-methylase UbiE